MFIYWYNIYVYLLTKNITIQKSSLFIINKALIYWGKNRTKGENNFKINAISFLIISLFSILNQKTYKIFLFIMNLVQQQGLRKNSKQKNFRCHIKLRITEFDAVLNP
ncbi:hypothetical protein BpHYR1_005138 [Brachionus plicatilis]|uniref:Uncharacterized protein n=1 Tax=Brachionus plicatilis TaxID=10195 RepID=A0A3M7SPF6_BRAPC|nr:hypothetical protein BpHYR1_005138 [Brachionus plicatilis]